MHASCQTCPAPPARLGAGRVGGWGTLDQAPGGEQREEHRQADHHQRPGPHEVPHLLGLYFHDDGAAQVAEQITPGIAPRGGEDLPPGGLGDLTQEVRLEGSPLLRPRTGADGDGVHGDTGFGRRRRPSGSVRPVVASPLEMSTIAAGALGGGAFPGDCGLGAPVPAPPPAGLACSCNWGTVATATARASPGAASAAVRRRPRAGPTAPWSRVGGSRRYAVWE